MPVEHFRSKEAERKNLAYRHIHGIPFTATKVVIGKGKHASEHTVKHSPKGTSRYRLDAQQKHKEAKRKG